MIRTIASRARLLGRRKALPMCRQTMATFAEKERGEESRYFAAQDAEKISAMKQKVDAILALEDDHDAKEELVQLLGKSVNV